MSDDIKKLVERLRATFLEETVFSLTDVRDAADALEAMGQYPGATFATDPAPVCEWKPIETAPKDGTEFIVFRDDAGVFTARYVASNDDGEMFLASMYGEDLTGDMMPTHWMPLPPPPPEAKE